MALSSMTGFARVSFEADGAKYSWELKSVNGRGLEIRVKLPAGLDHLETEIRAAARDALARGSCFFALQKEGAADKARLVLDDEALTLVLAAARRLAAVEGIGMPSADGLLAIPGVLQDRGDAVDEGVAERRDAAALQALASGLEALKAARVEEGRRLRTVIEAQLAAIEERVEAAMAVAAKAPEALKARIRDQVALLIDDNSGLDPDRLHQEALLAATRADVSEELDRLKSHVAGTRDLLKGGDVVGRRLEFLAQEFNREANTLCAKAFDRRLTAIGVELKAVIDQLREQAQNLE
jgi:uncharacterized protein (TIGR00255 family)